MARLRAASQWSKERSRSLVDLSWSRVLKMNARVRSPGSSASVTRAGGLGAALAVGVLEAAERLHQLQRLVGVGERRP